MSDPDLVITSANTELAITMEVVGINDAAVALAAAVSAEADAVATAADRVQTAADRVVTTGDAVATAADRVQTGLDRVQTAADRVVTTADAVATAADRVQTDLDRTAAAASAAAAAASYDLFDDRYLGAKTANPALDNDGNALVAGATYFNTVATAFRIYDGASWLSYSPATGMLDLVDDVSPQLGGNLDLNGHVITGMVIGTNVEAYDATILKSADIGVTVQGYDATTLKSAAIGVSVQAYDATALNAADIGVSVQGYDATTLKSADIGVTVQGYDAKTSAIAALTWAADRIAYFTSAGAAAIATLTSQARTLLALGDPGADRVMIWDFSASAYVAATLGTGIEISGTGIRVIQTFGIALSDETTAITTGTNKATMSLPRAFTVTNVYATLNTVSSSGIPTVDINEAGATILSTKLTIDASEKTSATAATAAVISDAAIAANAEIGFDIDVAGTGAKGLKVFIEGYWT